VAEAYIYSGADRKRGVVADEGYFLGYFFGLEGWTFMQPVFPWVHPPTRSGGGGNGGAA